MYKKRLLATIATIVPLAAAIATIAGSSSAAVITPAFAFDLSDGSNWGSATQDAAPLGDHASSTEAGGDVPTGQRSGLGNLAQDTGSWCNLLSALGSPC